MGEDIVQCHLAPLPAVVFSDDVLLAPGEEGLAAPGGEIIHIDGAAK